MTYFVLVGWKAWIGLCNRCEIHWKTTSVLSPANNRVRRLMKRHQVNNSLRWNSLLVACRLIAGCLRWYVRRIGADPVAGYRSTGLQASSQRSCSSSNVNCKLYSEIQQDVLWRLEDYNGHSCRRHVYIGLQFNRTGQRNVSKIISFILHLFDKNRIWTEWLSTQLLHSVCIANWWSFRVLIAVAHSGCTPVSIKMVSFENISAV